MKKRVGTEELINYRIKRIGETIGGNQDVQSIWFCLKDIIDRIKKLEEAIKK